MLVHHHPSPVTHQASFVEGGFVDLDTPAALDRVEVQRRDSHQPSAWLAAASLSKRVDSTSVRSASSATPTGSLQTSDRVG